MAGSKVTLYVDAVSPFAYMAYYILRQSPAFKPATITYVPVFLGGIMQSTGNRPPIQIKNKDKWIDTERRRWCKHFSIPIADGAPDNFPINTLPIARCLCAIQLKHPDKLIPALDLFFERVWGPERNKMQAHDPKAGLPAVLTQILGETAAKEVIAATSTDEVKKHLQSNTSQAMNDGAFGLPWFQCTNAKGESEGFWGFDHLGQVVEFMGLERRQLGSGGKAML